MSPFRFAGDIYRGADKALGGLLPGGGTPNPVIQIIRNPAAAVNSARQVVNRVTQAKNPVRQAVSAVRRAPAVAARGLRDTVIVPAIDKGIESGVLPVKEAMFTRYMTGTEKPLTVYPKLGKEAINKSLDSIAIENTRSEVNQLYKGTNPDYIKLREVVNKLNSMEKAVSNRAEMKGVPPTLNEQLLMTALQKEKASLANKLNIKGIKIGTDIYIPNDVLVNPSREERLKIIEDNKLFDKRNMATSYKSAYEINLPEDIQLTLGRFSIKNGEIQDRYKFDRLDRGRSVVPGWGSVYPDAAGGGKVASDIIELGLRTGVITPKSGYDVRIPLD